MLMLCPKGGGSWKAAKNLGGECFPQGAKLTSQRGKGVFPRDSSP
jgi:hypothetical protein